MPKEDFRKKWTIYDVGTGRWQQLVAFGAQFELVDDGNDLKITLLRGFHRDMGDPGKGKFDSRNGKESLRANFPGMGLDVIFDVTKWGSGHIIGLSFIGSEHGPEHPAAQVPFLVHGGPHGVDS